MEMPEMRDFSSGRERKIEAIPPLNARMVFALDRRERESPLEGFSCSLWVTHFRLLWLFHCLLLWD